MRFLLVFILFIYCGYLKSQNTFVKKIDSVVGEYSFGPTGLFQRSDSSYLILYSYKLGLSKFSPAYSTYNSKGAILKESKLNTGISHFNYQFKEAILTSDDGIFLMANADGDYPHAIRYDKNFTEQWRVFSNNRVGSNPKLKVPITAIEVAGKLVTIATDSNDYKQSVMVYKSLTGDSVLLKDLSEYCASCSDSVLANGLYSINTTAYMYGVDNTLASQDLWDVYQLKLLQDFDTAQVDLLNPYTKSFSVNVTKASFAENTVILNDSIKKAENNLVSRSLDVKTGTFNDDLLNGNALNGKIYSVYDKFYDSKGNLYMHALIEGSYPGVKFQRVLFKYDQKGRYVKHTVLYPFYDKKFHDLYWVYHIISTKEGGFALNIKLNSGGTEPPQYFIVTDSNLNVDGKPFYDQFIPEDTTSISSYESADVLLKVYPNPANSILNVLVAEGHEFELSLIDINGRVLKVFNAESNTQLEVAEFPEGLYFLRVKGEAILETRKVIIRH